MKRRAEGTTVVGVDEVGKRLRERPRAAGEKVVGGSRGCGHRGTRCFLRRLVDENGRLRLTRCLNFTEACMVKTG